MSQYIRTKNPFWSNLKTRTCASKRDVLELTILWQLVLSGSFYRIVNAVLKGFSGLAFNNFARNIFFCEDFKITPDSITYFRFYASHPDTWMHLDQGPQTVYSAYAQWVVSWGLFFRLFGHMEPYDFCPILFYSPSRLM